jgi:hypothetical protein
VKAPDGCAATLVTEDGATLWCDLTSLLGHREHVVSHGGVLLTWPADPAAFG